MASQTVKIATRKSPLALWQAEAIRTDLQRAHPQLDCELVPMSTEGDRFLSAKLTEIGGKNVFLKELEQAMLEGRADIAVHSMKDVTAELPAFAGRTVHRACRRRVKSISKDDPTRFPSC